MEESFAASGADSRRCGREGGSNLSGSGGGGRWLVAGEAAAVVSYVLCVSTQALAGSPPLTFLVGFLLGDENLSFSNLLGRCEVRER
jgi:hypothetical protein